MNDSRSAGERSKRCLGRIVDQVLIGTRVAMVGGALTGSLAAVYLLTGEYSQLLPTTWAARGTILVHLLALGGLVAAVVLLPLELLLGCALCLSSRVRAWASPWRLYVTSYGVGLLGAVGFLEVGFNRVRDLKTGLGAATAAAFVMVPLLIVVLLNRRPPSTPWRAAHSRRSVSLRTLAALVVLALTFGSTTPLVSGFRRVGAGATAGESGATGGSQFEPNSPQASRGPAVLLVSIDTLRADHLGAYGYHRPTTPHIDALAREAVLFERAYSPTSWTLPSHATMLTGLYPAHHGVRFADNSRFLNSKSADVLGGENVTLAELLSSAGYTTAAFTSMHWLSPAFGFDQGFDLLESDQKSHTAGVVVDKAIAWLDRQGPEPFFLFLHFFDVHEYESPPAYLQRFHPGDYSGQVKGQKWKTMGDLWQHLSADDLAYIEATYDGALNYVDAELGRLLDHLRGRGRFDEALIIVTADHGEEFLDHAATGHGHTLYEELVRVPLVLKPPHGEGGPMRSEGPAALVDLVPTVLDYAGLQGIAPSDGVSLRSVIRGDHGEARSLHFSDVFFQNRAAILAGDYKFIANRLPPLEPFQWGRLLNNLRTFFKFEGDELYDLAADPEERRNLAPSERALTAQLRERLLDHQRSSSLRTVEAMDAETVEKLRALGYLD